MLKATYYHHSKTRKRRWNLKPTPLLIAVIVLALLGYLYLSAHGPILIRLW